MKPKKHSKKKLIATTLTILVMICFSVVGLYKLGFFDSPTEKHLRHTLAKSDATVTLLASTKDFDWKEALITCPYIQAGDVPTEYQASLENLTTDSESFNWVHYRLANGTVISHEVSRKTADFCGNDSFFIITPKCEFTFYDLGTGKSLKPNC